MAWAPMSLQNIIKFSLDIKYSNTNNAEDINKLKQNIDSLKLRIDSNDITPRELKACQKLIDKNIELISDKSDTINLSFKQIQARIADLFTLITQSAESKIPVETSALPSSTVTTKPQPVLNCVFLCNLDSEDHNSAIMSRIPVALSENVPFITTQSLLCGTDLELNKTSKGNSIKNDILRSSQNCRIYIQGEFVVFIPKNYPFTADELGFDPERLLPIKHISEVFQGPAHAPKIEDFIQLFKADSKVKKRMILNGHGSVGCIGGLTLEHYRQLIEFLDRSGGEWLEIQSCHGGSLNTIEHYYEEEKKVMQSDEEVPQANSSPPQPSSIIDQKKTTSEKPKKAPSFPICIRSIGSFVTRASAHSKAYKNYFDNLDKYLSKCEIATISKYKDMIREVNKNILKPEKFNNYLQVKFSYPFEAPGGFRPLGEDPSSQIITYGELRVAEIERTPYISIDGKKHIELLPLNIRTPLNIRFSPSRASSPYTLQSQDSSSTLMLGEAPILLSMIPGSAHHLMAEVQAEGFSPFDLFLTNALVYDQAEVEKAFFIGKLHTKDAKYTKVVLEFSEKVSNLFFAEGDPELYYHYQLDLKTKTIHKTALTPVEFYFEILQTSLRTTSDDQALRSASGGQESEKQFEMELFENCFWDNDNTRAGPLPADVANYKKYILKPSQKEAEAFVQSLHPQSYQPVLTQAITDSDNQLIALLLNSEHVDVNKKNTAGRTLLFLATLKKNANALKLLIEKGADINTPSLPYGFTPLMLAVQTKLGDIVDLLLHHASSLNFDAQTSQGWTVFGMGKATHPIFKKVYEALKMQLIHKDKLEGEALAAALAKRLNHVSEYGYTLLSYETMKDHPNEIEELLKFGADPYAGNPSSLSKAIYERNPSMVEFWLKKNFDILKPDDKGFTALEYACLRGTPKILALLLKNIDLSSVLDASALFTKTLEQSHLANAKLLLAAGLDISKMPLQQLLECFAQLFRYQDLNLIDSLLDKIALPLAQITDIELSKTCHELFQYCLSDNTLELGKRFVKLLENNLNLYDEEDYLDGKNFLEHTLNSINVPLMQLLMQHGADPTQTMGSECVLERLVYILDAESLSRCLESAKHIDLNKDYSYKNLQVQIYEKYPHLTQTLLDKGADPTYKTYRTPSLLETIIRTGDASSLVLCLKAKPDIVSKADAEDMWTQAIKSNDLELFKVLMQAGFNLVQPPAYFDAVFHTLLISKSEWLEVYLDKICPNKDGNNIPYKEVFKALEAEPINDKILELLTHYGVKFVFENHKSKIKNIFKKQNISVIAFVFNHLPHDSKISLLNRSNFGEKYLIPAIKKERLDLFKFYLEQGADPLQKPSYGDSVFSRLLSSKPDWLKLCLDKICPNKNGSGIPLKEIFNAMKKNALCSRSFQLLKEYGAEKLKYENNKHVIEIIQHCKELEQIDFTLSTLSVESKAHLLNHNPDAGDLLNDALYRENLPLFELLVKHGADLQLKRGYSPLLVNILRQGAVDFLLIYLNKICPANDGSNIAFKELASTIEHGNIDVKCLQLLKEYGVGQGNAKAESILEKAIKNKTEGAQ